MLCACHGLFHLYWLIRPVSHAKKARITKWKILANSGIRTHYLSLTRRLASIIRNSFMFKNGNRRYKYLVLGHEESYFVKEHSDSKHKYSEDDIIKMLEFLVDNIFVVFAGKVFQQIVGIPMGTNCPSSSRHISLLIWSRIYTVFEAEFIQSLLSTSRVRTPGVQVENTSSVSPACRKRRLKGRRYIAIVAETA